MKLEEMFPNYLFLPPTDQLAFIVSYRGKRMEELASMPIAGSLRKSKETSKNDVLTEDEKKVLKKLGISLKEYTALNSLGDNLDQEEDDAASYFTDSTFNGDEEEE